METEWLDSLQKAVGPSDRIRAGASTRWPSGFRSMGHLLLPMPFETKALQKSRVSIEKLLRLSRAATRDRCANHSVAVATPSRHDHLGPGGEVSGFEAVREERQDAQAGVVASAGGPDVVGEEPAAPGAGVDVAIDEVVAAHVLR